MGPALPAGDSREGEELNDFVTCPQCDTSWSRRALGDACVICGLVTR